MAKSVLIVDDAYDIRAVMRTAFAREGYRVTEAGDAKAALHALATQVPDLLVSDIMMPDMDGLELLAHARADPRLLGLPVIFMTAATDAATEERARDLGVDHFVRKPVEPRALLATARSTIERFAQLRRAGVVRTSAVPTPAPAPDAEPTGVEPLDELTGGLPRGHAYYVSGPVGLGKSALAVQFVHHALAREEAAVVVTTDRPSLLLSQANALGLALDPFLVTNRLAVLELAGHFDGLIGSPDDVALLQREMTETVRELRATRLVVSSVLTLLASSPRVPPTATLVSAFLRHLEEAGVTTLLFGEPPATEEEQLADAFIRRSSFGSFRLVRTEEPAEVRTLVLERLLCPHGQRVECAYSIVPGRGLVAYDPTASTPIDRAALLARIKETLEEACRENQSVLVQDRGANVRVRDAWALAFRDCVDEALRNDARCTLLLAQLLGNGKEPPPADVTDAVTTACGPMRAVQWVNGTDLVVLGVGDDEADMESLARSMRARLNEARPGRDPQDITLASAVVTFTADSAEGILESLRRLSPKVPMSDAG